MTLRQGIVVAVHPEDHSVDLVMVDDGTRMVGVQVLTPNGSGKSGTFDMAPVPEREQKWDISKPVDGEQIAIVGFMRGQPVVLGFLYPQISQMTFKDGQTRVYRHSSDVMFSIDGAGNVQLLHPSGTYIRIGQSTEKGDLSLKNADESLALTKNLESTPSVHVGMAGGLASFTISPEGNITIKAVGIALESETLTHNGINVGSTHVHTGVLPGPANTGPPAS